MKCCICGKEIKGYSNSAYPISDGKCCDSCNLNYVVPARISLSKIKKGSKIKIIEMKDEPTYDGTIGVVNHIDSIGQIHGSWGGCALIPGIDKFEVIE